MGTVGAKRVNISSYSLLPGVEEEAVGIGLSVAAVVFLDLVSWSSGISLHDSIICTL
jgi:hypothetical protein